MNRAKAKSLMLEFTKSHLGEMVFFAELGESERLAFVMVDTFSYFSNFLGIKESLDRAIKNAESHKNQGFDIYYGKKMKIKES